MLDQTIRRLLALYPRGATDDQLIWRLRSSGLRIDASELLAGLLSLAERKEIVRGRNGRWMAASHMASAEPTTSPNLGQSNARAKILFSVPATYKEAEAARPAGIAESPTGGPLPDWATLLGYYAATQRQDPRGQIVEFPDRHAVGWQLFRSSGHWWEDAELRVGLELLPESFREALARRTVRTAAVGWPVSIFSVAEGPACIPGLILPTDWRIEGADLVLSLQDSQPTINPAWLKEVRRNSNWNESKLVETLFPEGEESDLAAVSSRMRLALATLGGQQLRPADLAPELVIHGTGLQNAAALFLIDDGTFTKGAADDLEALRAWPTEMRSGTALEALFARDTRSSDSSEVAVLSPTGLTDSQLEAAEAALQGPLTVIQGPPGTGKSQVILSVIVSIVMAGRSVLFAAKNHQALDEVERRMKEIIPDAPLLVRGRDADGDRNKNFLDALFDIAGGETRSTTGLDGIENTRLALLNAAQSAAADRQQTRDRITLHLTLSELTDRHELICRHLPDGSAGRPRISWVKRISLLLHRLVGRPVDITVPLPDLAPLAEVNARITEVRRRVKNLGSQPIQDGVGDSGQAEASAEIRSFLPRFASVKTQAREADWARISDRAQEIRFDNIRSARRMLPEDARAVLQHRPVWAVSTLSVPSRVPLIPGLFDYVIFDESSQCDIASALPLLARARKAVVVGDPMQLRFVPALGVATEHALMDAERIPQKGRASIAQSINSLFDFCARQPNARRVFLRDQFRSAPQIVDYLNSDFYDGKLISRREDEAFRPPSGYKPGLAWEDVAGTASLRDGGTVNKAEAEHIVTILRRMADDMGFKGTVGVISPFNSQVAEIEAKTRTHLTPSQRERLSLRVATVDKFQGGEADVVLFSLVLAPSCPSSTRTFLLKERRRLNVAISRARALCIVVGDLAYARSCNIRHIEYLAQRAVTPWSPPRPPFDSDWERRLDTAMRARALQPIPQYSVGTRYLDFALDPEGVKLDVEVDGRRWHLDADGNRKVSDRLRDAELRARGWKVLRFWVHELANDMEACLDRIEHELKRA
ncbi:MAG: DUF559 domain-containing protein [Mesorhizobium sp.]|uniref:AAA domain-containing protein n=1 Tax=Mesorhizobium sp. TaxID=1871066 RepID=UPI000FE4F0E7|nr:AAA domain-containing protein [Mesorhizobium sp.]RWK87962.1 MAG: DUF559 domain-containing protein [Mesorhizobium sp.]